MRFYHDMAECHGEIKRDLKEMGVAYISDTVQDKDEPIETLELINYGYTLLEPNHQDIADFAAEQEIYRPWLIQEAKDRTDLHLKDKNPNPAYVYNSVFWSKFIRDGCFSYTYPERLHPQIPRILHELRTRPNTRHAILTMYDQHQDLMNLGGRDRVPCSMYYQFMIRREKLYCSYTMRSCDFTKFFLADAYLAIYMQTWIADKLTLRMGDFTHFIGSLHTFKGELKGVF